MEPAPRSRHQRSARTTKVTGEVATRQTASAQGAGGRGPPCSRDWTVSLMAFSSRERVVGLEHQPEPEEGEEGEEEPQDGEEGERPPLPGGPVADVHHARVVEPEEERPKPLDVPVPVGAP